MKPLSIKMQAFGPYLKPISLDFSPLYDARIFLISGPTGGGKTSILDAMSFALYGKATGAARSFRDMRCIAAPDDEDTVTEFSFSLGDKIYRFRRSMHIRTKRSGEKDDTIDAECAVKSGDEWNLLESGHDKVIKKAEEILGFNHEQFSQVIVLPQGEFRRLLLANSKEKAKILEVLFATSVWQKVGDSLGFEVRGIGAKLAELENGESVLLESVKLEDFEQLAAQLEQTKSEYEQTTDLLKIAKEQFDRDAAALNAGKSLAEAFESRKKAQEQRERLAKRAAEMAQSAEKLKNAQKVKTVLPYYYSSLTEAKTVEKRKTELDAAKERLAKSEKAFATADEKKKNIPQAQKNEQILREEIARINTLLPDARQFEAVVKSAEAAKTHAEALSVQMATLGESRQKLEERIAAGEQWVLKSLEDYKNAERDELINAFAAKTAAALKEGEPCPVCGSVHHPALAQPVAAGGKSAAQAKAEHQRYEKKLEQLKAERAASAEEEMKLQTAFDEAGRALLIAQERARTIRERVGNAGSAQTLLAKLKEQTAAADNVVQQINDVRRAAETAAAELAAAKETLRQVEKALAESRDQAADTRRAFENAMLGAGFVLDYNIQAAALSQEEEALLERRLRDYETLTAQTTHELELWQVKLADKQPPDLPALLAAKDEAQTRLSALTEGCARLDERVKRMSATKKQIEQLRQSSETLREEYSAVCRVSDLVSGKNAMKTPLHNFVLGLMLDDVVVAASRYLQKLSRGRYALVRADYAGGAGLRGLDIEVTDAHTGGQRKAGTLSGGELFLASLSLAFGLAEVVQSFAGGVKLDSIFIDEGFGTLDSETLEAAMKALADIQSEGRLVGIISHVSELKSRIPAHIEVRAGEDGSTLSVKGV